MVNGVLISDQIVLDMISHNYFNFKNEKLSKCDILEKEKSESETHLPNLS